MKVEQILQAKGSDVYVVSSQATLSEVVDILHERNIGAVVVKDNESVAGILSERDIVRRIKLDGVSALDCVVSSCMTADVVTCAYETTVDELMTQMTEKRIRHIPVIDAGKLVGLVSIGDVVKRKIKEAEEEAAALRDYISS